jgi:hypothetical protein
MRRFLTIALSMTACGVLMAGPVASAQLTKCQLSYNLEGWSVFYKTSKGAGHITCTNGQSANVSLRAHGGGLTFGKFKVIDGHGTFSGVQDVADLYGTYAEAAAHAGAGGSTDARVMTKGEVSLSLTGKGQGVNLGVGFGGFTIRPR